MTKNFNTVYPKNCDQALKNMVGDPGFEITLDPWMICPRTIHPLLEGGGGDTLVQDSLG
jgi:hypothetical protein